MTDTFPQVLFSSAKEDWATPLKVFEELDEEFDFLLDAAASEWNHKCLFYYTKDDDALSRPWYPFQRIWLNPPYSRQMKVWIKKAREEAKKGATVVLLVPSRTDVAWFHDYVHEQAEVRFLRGRLKFERPDGPKDAATFPSMVIIMRPTDESRTKGEIKMTEKYYTRLQANVKVPIDTELQPLNMFVGGNKQGKTAGIEAAVLAQTGRLPGLVHGKDVTSFVPKGVKKITAKLSNGNLSTEFSAASGKKLPVEPAQSEALRDLVGGAEHIIPSVSLRDLLGKSAAKSREAIMHRFGKIKTISVPKGFNEEQIAFWIEAVADVAEVSAEGEADSVLAAATTAKAPAEILAGLQSWFDSAQRKASGAANNKEKELDVLQDVHDDAAGAELIPQLEQQRDVARIHEHQASNRVALQSAHMQMEELQPRAQEIIRTYEDAEVDIKLLTRARADAAAEIEEIRVGAQGILKNEADAKALLDRAQSAFSLVTRCAGAEVDNCPFCASSGIDWDTRVAAISALVDARAATYIAAENAAASITARISSVEESLAADEKEAQDKYTGAQQAREALRAQAQALKTQIVALEGAIGDASAYDGPSVADLDQQILRYRAAEGQRMSAERMDLDVRELRTRAEMAKTLKTEAKKMLAAALRKTKKAAEKAVNTHMPEGFQASLSISDTVCQWQVIGTDGRAHNRHTMCGSEKATIIVALALAWTEDAPLRILTLDDNDLAMLEPENLTAMLQRIEELHAEGKIDQVFSAWPAARLDHVSDIPKAWNVINVGEC